MAPLLDPGTFESIHVEISGENLTSRFPMPSEPAPQFIEISEHGLTVSLASGSCQQGHRLNLVLQVSFLNVKIKMSVTSKVLHVDKTGAGVDRVELVLVQFDQEKWDEITYLFKKRQETIEGFFKAVRGDA
jgi:hypothetical protein